MFEILSDKVASVTERERLCIITFDEMSLRSGLSYNITEDAVEGFKDWILREVKKARKPCTSLHGQGLAKYVEPAHWLVSVK